MIALSETELILLKDTLDRVKDEFDALVEECDAVFNSGAVEEVDECLVIIDALYNKHLAYLIDKGYVREVVDD